MKAPAKCRGFYCQKLLPLPLCSVASMHLCNSNWAWQENTIGNFETLIIRHLITGRFWLFCSGLHHHCQEWHCAHLSPGGYRWFFQRSVQVGPVKFTGRSEVIHKCKTEPFVVVFFPKKWIFEAYLSFHTFWHGRRHFGGWESDWQLSAAVSADH